MYVCWAKTLRGKDKDKHIGPDLRIEWKELFLERLHTICLTYVSNPQSLCPGDMENTLTEVGTWVRVQIAFEYLDRRVAHFIHISKYAYCRLCAKNDLMEKRRGWGGGNWSRAGWLHCRGSEACSQFVIMEKNVKERGSLWENRKKAQACQSLYMWQLPPPARSFHFISI